MQSESTKPSRQSAVPTPARDVHHRQILLDDLISPAGLASERPDLFTEQGLRWLIRQRRANGLERVGAVLIVRNRQVLVRSRFERWLAEQVA